MMSSVIVLTHI